MQQRNDATNKKNFVHFVQFQNNIKSLQGFQYESNQRHP